MIASGKNNFMKNILVTDKTQIYIIGGGIASLSCAVFCIRDGHIPGENIHILESSKSIGGAMDATGTPEEYYNCRGVRLLNEKTFNCYWDVLSEIPSLDNPSLTVKDEIFEFNKKYKLNAHSRLIREGHNKIDVSSLDFRLKEVVELIKLMVISENVLDNVAIEEWFSSSFFKSKFWYLFASMFGFEQWHSAIEMKRYLNRFAHGADKIKTLHEVGLNTPYNNYESVILPIISWLKKNKVNIVTDCTVTDLKFNNTSDGNTVESLKYNQNDKENNIIINNGDYVFATLGSMTADSIRGSMKEPPVLEGAKRDGSWDLWENISAKITDLGNPSTFSNHLDKSKWVVFSITCKDNTFAELYKKFTGNKIGEGHIETFVDSNWLMSIHVPFQPFFKNQPSDTTYIFGYGLLPDKKGDFVNKTMLECTGEEILTELYNHFGFTKEITHLLANSICIPNLLPYATSQFLVRKQGDRPAVVPEGSKNFALMGQYCEIPSDCVFTVEYSVRSAQIGVYTLFGIDRKIPPIYKGSHHVRGWLSILKALF